MKIFILVLCLASFFSYQEARAALTSDAIKNAIYERMKDRHPTPDPSFWTNLGPEAVPVMEDMLGKSDSALEQSWLLDGLARFNDPSIGAILKSHIKASDNEVLKKKMLSALIESQGESSFNFVEPYLKDKEPHVRLAVAIGIQRFMPGLNLATERLKKFNSEESESWVKADFEKSKNEVPLLQKRADSVFVDQRVLKPLSEKEWAGEWNGVWLGIKNTSRAKAILTYLEKEKSWKVSLKLPKQTAVDFKRDGMEVLGYTSSHIHWIEVRNKKDDTVFIGTRKP